MDAIVVIILVVVGIFLIDISINLRRVNTNIMELLKQYKKLHGIT